MDFAYTLGGSAPLVKKFQIGEAMATAGVPVVVGGTGNEGVALGDTTTASVDLVGVTVDTQATLVTAQQSDGSDPERQVSVIINPDAVYRANLSGGATAGTALTSQTVTTASTDGLTVTTAAEWSSPEYLDGTVWGYSGANVGVDRKITGTSATAGTVTIAFPTDTAVGDVFLRVPYAPGEDQFVQLTSNLAHLDCSVAVDVNNNNFRVVELELKDSSDDGNTNSYGYIVPFDSIYAAGGSV